MRVNPFFMPVIVLVLLLGTIVVAQAAGIWSTSGRTSVDLGQMTPADIKGWMTIQQVMDGFSISQSDLYALAGIPADVPPSTVLKDLEPLIPGFEISTLRDALTARLGASGSIPTDAAGTPAQADVVNTPTPVPPTPVLPTPTPTVHSASTAAATVSGQVLPADQIKGKMTLREVSQQCGVRLNVLLTALKLPADTNPDVAIKDLVTQGKLAEVTTVQQAVADLQKQ
jgi:hypothetical protein